MRGATLLLAMTVASTALAADMGPASSCCEARRCCKCGNDYCPKPQPCVPCAPWGCCDDYCPKPMPCTLPLHYCGPNDYCPKPCCLYLPPCWPAWYSCGELSPTFIDTRK